MDRRKVSGFEWLGYFIIFIGACLSVWLSYVVIYRVVELLYHRGDLGAAMLALALLILLTVMAYGGGRRPQC